MQRYIAKVELETLELHLHFASCDTRGHVIHPLQIKIQRYDWTTEETIMYLTIIFFKVIKEKKNITGSLDSKQT